MLLCLLFVALTVVAGAEKCGTGPRRVFIDLGANWCNTLRLYEDLVDKETTLPDAPWEIFAFEASPLIAPYADRFVAWLNGERQAKPALCLPASGSSTHLRKYAEAYGCGANRSKNDVNKCMFEKLDPVLSRLAPEPRLNNSLLINERLNSTRCAIRGTAATAARYTFLPVAAGAAPGFLDFYNLPRQLIRGGSVALESNKKEIKTLNQNNFWNSHAPVLRVRVVDVASWLGMTFRKEDYVMLKIDVEGSEFSIFEKLIKSGWLSLIDLLVIEAHPSGFRGTMFNGANALIREIRQRQPALHIIMEGAASSGESYVGIDSHSWPLPRHKLRERVDACSSADLAWIDVVNGTMSHHLR